MSSDYISKSALLDMADAEYIFGTTGIRRIKEIPTLDLVPAPVESMICAENENFIQNKFGFCFYASNDCPFIYNLYVHTQYRRRGHSKELLRLVINKIRENGYDGKILIEARPKENSIGLADLTEYYKSLGLTIYDAHKEDGGKE